MSHANPDAERGSKPALGAYFIIPLLACALTIYFLVSTRDLLWEARVTGTFIGVILLILCAVQIFRLSLTVVRGEATLGFGDLFENTLFNRQRLALLVFTTAFVVALPWIGTTVGLFILLVASVRIMGVRDWRVLVGVAFITAAMVHLLLIYLLGSQLPQGIFKGVFSAIGI
jgi:hypothetical protein